MVDEAPERQRKPEQQRESLAEPVAQHGRGTIALREVAIGQAGELEVLHVALEPGAEGRCLRGLRPREILVGPRRPLAPHRAVLRIARRVGHLLAPNRLGCVDELESVPVAGLDDQPLERFAEALGQPPDRVLGVRRRERQEIPGGHGPPH